MKDEMILFSSQFSILSFPGAFLGCAVHRVQGSVPVPSFDT